MFENFGPCIIIIDELVRYASNIYGKNSNELNCSFDSLQTFVQNLTEAVKRTKNSLVVAAIPESDIEMGGAGGKTALKIIENTFGRLEKVWKPVKPIESFEIVRRRLFTNVYDNKMRDSVSEAFYKLYLENPTSFPSECKESQYFERLKNSYPIHPEVFDRLYDDWAEIETFQKTRGVLRLMAAVIHELWIQNDRSLMIMPGLFPIGSTDVHAELTRYLDDQWNTVLDTDVDGERSEPKRIDEENPRLGAYMAARRVSRAIFLGSAPSVESQKLRGIEEVRVRLGVIQPGEQIPVFNDALSKLLDKLVHLYMENKRYWFDTRANLRKTVEDRASRFDLREITIEVQRRLETRERGDFSRVQVYPSSDDVLDEQEIKLIVLPMKFAHKSAIKKSSAIIAAEEILDKKGNTSRQKKNMLVFVCADGDLIKDLERETRQFLAWKSVDDDAESLDLKTAERRQAKEFTFQSNKTLQNKIFETYCWLLVPTQEGMSVISWDLIKIPGNEDYSIKATKKLKSSELLISQWSPALLKMELDKWIWKNEPHVNVKKLWNYLTSYPYLTRLRDENVLINTIQEGLKSNDFFGYANAFDDKGKYFGLSIGKEFVSISLDDESLLIKPEIALKQLELEKPMETKTTETFSKTDSGNQESIPQEKPTPKLNFYGTVSLDWETVAIKSGEIATEIIQHLKALKDSNVEINLEIRGIAPHGIPDDIIRTLSENCKTLKFKDWEFSE